jgi:hypothetical protein
LEGRFEILEVEPEASRDQWRNEFKPELKAEGYSRCTIALEPTGAAMKLTITHAIDRAEAKLIDSQRR